MDLMSEEGSDLVSADNPRPMARDGTQRGFNRRGVKNKRTLLLEAIKSAVERDSGVRDWDPVVMMSVVAARAFAGYPATDNEGRPILDEKGQQVMVPPDPALAVAAAAKVAPYVHSQLRPREDGDDADSGNDPDEIRERVLTAFENMGVKIERTLDDGTS